MQSDTLGEDRTGFDPTTGTYHLRLDSVDTGNISVAVIETVSVATGREPTSLRPLSEATDADALNALITHRDAECEITFAYEGCTVTVSSWGDVTVRRLSDGNRDAAWASAGSE